MAWTDRLRPEIRFTSPTGRAFAPLWKGNDISAEKRLGRHAYPNLDKEVVQDMGMSSRDVPLTVYFDGPDNDKNAADFETALHESGPWQVIHPVYGLFRLQLVSYGFGVEPVESGNVTVFKTEWIDFFDDEEIAAVTDPAAAVEAAAQAVKEATLLDMATVTQETASQNMAVKNTVKQALDGVKNTFRAADTKTLFLQNQLSELVSSSRQDIPALAKGIIELIGSLKKPALGPISSKISMFASLGNLIMAGLPFAGENVAMQLGPAGTQGENENPPRKEYAASANIAGRINRVLAGQAFLNAITAAMGEAVISRPAETRREALTALNVYRKFSGETRASLDRAAATTGGNRIERQFAARANSGEAVSALDAAVTRYLLSEIFDLKTGRRVTLDRPRAPLEIAVAEYKARAENADYYYALFCRTNNLHGRETLLLPAGREVVIYA